MFAELLPFWTKHWYHVVICIVSCYFLKLFYVSTKGIAFTKNNRNSNTADQLEGSGYTSLQRDGTYGESQWRRLKDRDPKQQVVCLPIQNRGRLASLHPVPKPPPLTVHHEETFSDGEEPALPKDLKHVPYKYERPTETELYSRASEFYKIVAARRTIRFFSPDPVPKQVIREIIKAAGTTPSGAHTEPWTFVVVSNQEVKEQIRRIVENEEEINYKKRMGPKWTADLVPLRTNWIKEYLTTAPYLILVFKQIYRILPNGGRKVHYYNEMSTCIACGILITAIQYAGLVTVISTPLNCGPGIRNLLRRPPNEKLLVLLPVGYPAEDATVPDLQRKSLSDILVEID